MNLKQFGICLSIAVSHVLFIRASIVSIFSVYGDPLDEMYMSILSLTFVLLAFSFVLRRGSFLVGFSLISIGTFYIYNGNRMLALVLRDMEYIPYPEGMINADILTMVAGAAIFGCGIYAVLRRSITEKRGAAIKTSV